MSQDDSARDSADTAQQEDTWWRVTIEIERPAIPERVGEQLVHLGALGIELRDEETFSEFADSAFGRCGDPQVIAYFGQAVDVSTLQTQLEAPLLARGHGGTCTVLESEALDSEAWGESWKQYFVPQQVSGRVYIRPSWDNELPESANRADAVVLVVDPKMAFGTGSHETTRLCLQHLDATFAAHATHATHAAHAAAVSDREDGAMRLLDVGCGSGILSMAARLLGASAVRGIDHDQDAIDVARENWDINEMGGDAPFDTTELATLLKQTPTPAFEFVVANILAHILLTLRDDLYSAVCHNGQLILSGVMTSERERFLAEFLVPGWRLATEASDGEWCLLVLEESGSGK